MSDFRDIMRRNWDILDLDKIQDNWYDKVALHSIPFAYRVTPVGAVETNLGCSVNAGRNFSKTSVMSLKKSSILPG